MTVQKILMAPSYYLPTFKIAILKKPALVCDRQLCRLLSDLGGSQPLQNFLNLQNYDFERNGNVQTDVNTIKPCSNE